VRLRTGKKDTVGWRGFSWFSIHLLACVPSVWTDDQHDHVDHIDGNVTETTRDTRMEVKTVPDFVPFSRVLHKTQGNRGQTRRA